MGDFNMPPGCSVSDIPGNRPEDAAAEAFEEAMCSKFQDVEKLLNSTSGVDQLTYNLFVEVADWAFSEGIRQGYDDGQADGSIADDVEELSVAHERQELLFKMEGFLQVLRGINDDCQVFKDAKISDLELVGTVSTKQTLQNQKKALDNLAALIENLTEL